MLVAMWRNSDGGLYLEPGEIAALAEAAQRMVPPDEPTHPRDLMLSALAALLDAMTAACGVVVTPAPSAVAHRAAQAYVRRSSDATLEPASRLPHTPRSLRPA